MGTQETLCTQWSNTLDEACLGGKTALVDGKSIEYAISKFRFIYFQIGVGDGTHGWLQNMLRDGAKSITGGVAAGPYDPSSLLYGEMLTGFSNAPVSAYAGHVAHFGSFRSAKAALEPIGDWQIHHIVEQSQIRRSGFTRSRVNSTDNLIRLPPEVHRQISAFYSTKYGNTGMTFREYLSGTSWDYQYQMGLKVVDTYMSVIKVTNP